MVLETHVGGSDSSMHLEVESNLNKSGGMEALRERKVCAATGIVSMRAACSPFFAQEGVRAGAILADSRALSAVRSAVRQRTWHMACGRKSRGADTCRQVVIVVVVVVVVQLLLVLVSSE